MDQYLTKLESSEMCLMIWNDEKVVFSSPSKGIRPHLEAIEKLGRAKLKGTIMVDKIVGRAAALLMLYSMPSEVHAGIITLKAKEMLEDGGVRVYADKTVSAIKEKDGRIYCPFEAMVQDIRSPDIAYYEIVKKMADIR